MNHLISIRTNVMYAKDGDDYKRYQELIFLVDKPQYRQTNGGEIVRERAIDELRFTVSDIAFDELINLLQKIREADEKDLE
jgi:hypothetical protein